MFVSLFYHGEIEDDARTQKQGGHFGMKDMNVWYQRATLLLLSGVIIVIFVLSSQPYRVQNIQPYLHRTLSLQKAEHILPNLDIRYDGKEYKRDANPFGLIEFLFRKGAHLFVYGVLAGMTALTLKQYRKQGLSIVIMSQLIVLLIALLDELNQNFSPARTPTYQDVLVDFTGGLLGLAVFFGINRLYRRLRMNHSSSA
jgi:VanZ family protein